MSEAVLTRDSIDSAVIETLTAQPVWDLHTHLYPPTFGTPVNNASGKVDPRGLMLWGVDELITYHYLIAEVYRIMPATKLPYEQFWKMSKRQQADHIWKHLFVERTPVSEACRGVLTAINLLGFDANDGLEKIRKHVDQQDPDRYIDRVMKVANVSRITMTNAIFDDNERNRWLADSNVGSDSRFRAVLRIDPLLSDWPGASKKLSEWGYKTSPELNQTSIDESKRFLNNWLDRMKAIYIAVSQPPEFRYPAECDATTRAGQTILEKVILPTCAQRKLPFAMMIGSRRFANPHLQDAGDMLGKADVQAVVRLCQNFPDNKFLLTMLSRENQHELAVAARKFGNLMVFGCWWFVNNPSLIEEITRMRMELLGTSFIPQHSDARILDQLVYKWDHSRKIIGKVMIDKYNDLMQTRWKLTRAQVQRDVKQYLNDNFAEFLGR